MCRSYLRAYISQRLRFLKNNSANLRALVSRTGFLNFDERPTLAEMAISCQRLIFILHMMNISTPGSMLSLTFSVLGDLPCRSVARISQQGGQKPQGGTFFRNNIGCMQQPGGQTWNGGTYFKWVGGRAPLPPLVTALFACAQDSGLASRASKTLFQWCSRHK